MKKIVFLIVGFFITTHLSCFPYRLVRLISPKGKIVDLIFEVHIKIKQPEPAASRRRPSAQKKEQLFGVAERRIADIFEILNKTQKIDLLWELDREIIAIRCPLEAVFLHGMGCKLAKQYALDKKQKITFVPADNFRNIIDRSLVSLYELDTNHRKFLQFPLSIVQDYLEQIRGRSGALGYLRKIESNVNNNKTAEEAKRKRVEKLIKIWQNKIVINLLKLKKVLNKYDSNITIAEFIKKLRTDKEAQAFAELWKQTILISLPDIEMLMKIIGSDKDHVILYAGGIHCQDVADILKKKFKYTKTIDIGMTNKIFDAFRNYNIEPLLSTKGLLHIALSSGHKAQGLMKESNVTLFSKVFAIGEEISFISILKKMKGLFKKTYIDLFNLQKNKQSLLHVAAQNSWNDAVAFILEQPDISLDMQDNEGETPLHKAIKNNHYYIVKQLLEKKASRHTRNKAGLNALDLAAKHGHAKIALLLLDEGSEINKQNPKTGDTALHLAAIANKQVLVFLLIKGGANVDIRNKDGKKPIYYATDKLIKTKLQQAMKKVK